MLQEGLRGLDAADGSNEDPLHSTMTETESQSAEPRKPSILVVDDEKRIADTMCEILNSVGFDATAAYDGWSALDAATQCRPDYLLSDVLMPRMNGVELAIAIRQARPATKILLFSGQAGISEILHSAQERGFTFDLIGKPIHPSRLIERLKQL